MHIRGPHPRNASLECLRCAQFAERTNKSETQVGTGLRSGRWTLPNVNDYDILEGRSRGCSGVSPSWVMLRHFKTKVSRWSVGKAAKQKRKKWRVALAKRLRQGLVKINCS